MIKNFKIVFLIICFFFIFENYTKSEEFFFESAEIKILENGNRLYSDLGVKVTTSDNTVITADKFDYNKITSLLKLRGNVVINDLDNQTKIRTNKIDYLKKLEKIISYDETIIFIKDEYTIKSENIIFLRNKKEIFSEAATNITDNYNNNFTSENFLFSIPDEILKGKNVTFKDHIGNKTTFENFFGDLKNKQVYGKNAKYFFNKGSFGNKKNEQRLYGNILDLDILFRIYHGHFL